MDQSTRNTLRNVVTQCRRLLEESVAQVLQGQFGIYATGKKDEVQIEPEARMSHLSEEDQAYRQDLLDHYEHIKALGYKAKDALAQLIREVAFTHLNRFCAYRMMESRSLIRESVSKGLKSQGFLFYLADHEEDERRFNTGQQDIAYRHFLNWLGGTLSEEIGVLFAPTDPANRLYPPQRVIDLVLGLINDPDLAGIWSEDEAIGWVYQYFTPKELRDQARKESQVPRNSYELAFRNQFFTPRYVVAFLTDNTLGRIWYEMRQSDTRLKDQCRYMVRRPTEVFLKDGEAEPNEAAKATDDLSQEELLKLPVYVPFRAKKDPRELRILDPACGSGHFLLYCFDLLLTIYEEAYGDPVLGQELKKDYPTLGDLRRDVPRLILAHNLHGIDIDPRASQIAALALWLRCQRAYQDMGIKQDRPKIKRSHVVCAEPMPGEEGMLKEFVEHLEPKILGQVVEVVFKKMKLAGEAGSLLKIEEEIRDAVAAAKKQYVNETTHATDHKGQTLLFSRAAMGSLTNGLTQPLVFDVSGIPDATFFDHAEHQVVDALRSYAENAQSGQQLPRSLFTEDAVRGFAFIDLCRQKYDVVLMNPPFGDPSLALRALVKTYCGKGTVNLLTAFVVRSLQLAPLGVLGALTDSTWLRKADYESLRDFLCTQRQLPSVIADLGWGVLDDANVAACAFVIPDRAICKSMLAFSHVTSGPQHRASLLHRSVDSLLSTGASHTTQSDTVFLRPWHFFDTFPNRALAFDTPEALVAAFVTWQPVSAYALPRRGYTPGDTFRFFRCWWEVPTQEMGGKWWPLNNGSPYTPLLGQGFFVALHDAPSWSHYRDCPGFRLESEAWFGKAGIGWGKRTDAMYAHPLPQGAMFSNESPALFPSEDTFWSILGWLNTNVAQGLVNLFCGQHKTAGYVALIPCPPPSSAHMQQIGRASESLWKAMQPVTSRDETLERFVAVISPFSGESIESVSASSVQAIDEYRQGLAAIDALAMDALRDITSQSEMQLPTTAAPSLSSCLPFIAAMKEGRLNIAELVQWALGIVFGRWDVRYAICQEWEPPRVEATSSVSQGPPALLKDERGAVATRTPPHYPFNVDWDGILVDAPEHQDDVCSRLLAVFELLWPEGASENDRRFVAELSEANLREYFRKPGKGGFWDDHISRYSKSRRKAPIYWLLQSTKKNYAIWLYYHRLDKDILFKALVNYVEPKIRLESDRLESLRSQKGEGGASKATKKLDKEIEKQEDFLSELRDFEEKLRRAAELHLVPDLNDGVVLNIASLHELVPWKEARSYWEELLEGKYEWSSIGKQLREKGLVT
jgi:hypothetical protein